MYVSYERVFESRSRSDSYVLFDVMIAQAVRLPFDKAASLDVYPSRLTFQG